MITEREAFVYWLRAVGKSYAEIAEASGLTVQQAIGLFGRAQKKATAEGLSYKHNPPKIDIGPGSGMCKAMELIQSEPTQLKGFAKLKAMAEEIGLKK